jgi:hypothetical protein
MDSPFDPVAFLSQISGCFPEQDGFCHPDWDGIWNHVSSQYEESQWHGCLTEAAIHWIRLLQSRAAGNPSIYETRNFIFLGPAARLEGEAMCANCESALTRILSQLRGIAQLDGYGKKVVLMFHGQDDYYQYISYFTSDGTHAQSGGVFLHSQGYPHFVFPSNNWGRYQSTIEHELTHSCLAHLPLPMWLNEAIAMSMESNQFLMENEPFEEHQDFWNKDNIQEFWLGITWDQPGGAQEMSYSLARILLYKFNHDLQSCRESMSEFINAAHYEDAGEKACQKVFGISLGAVVEDFLGSGDWQPHPATWVSLETDERPVKEDTL